MSEHNEYWRAGVEESRRITNVAYDALLELGAKHDALAAEVERLRRLLQAVYDEAGFEDGIWAEVKLELEGGADE